MDGYAFQIGLIAALIVLSGLLSGTETALLALGPAGIARILDEERRTSRLLRLWREHPNQILATLVLANNVVNILASALATSLAAAILQSRGVGGSTGWAIALSVGAMTLLLVVFGEVLPKTFAKHNARRFVVLFPLALVFCEVMRPLAWLLQKGTGWMIEAAGGSTGHDGEPEVTEAEIEAMIRLGTAQGALSSDKRELLASVIEFTETLTKEIMVPRTDVVGVPVEATVDEALKIVSERRFSRYPVYEEDLDTVTGVLTVKDLLDVLSGRAKASVRDLAARHAPLFVPSTKRIGDVLKDFQREHVQMAVAVDEFGGTAGIVTMEDVIEEIVGEIYDEHDRSEPAVRPAGPDRWLVAGRAEIEELERLFDVRLPDQEMYETVGGLVLTQAGRVPMPGEAVEYLGLRFEVRERTKTRILLLSVSRAAPGAEETR